MFGGAADDAVSTERVYGGKKSREGCLATSDGDELMSGNVLECWQLMCVGTPSGIAISRAVHEALASLCCRDALAVIVCGGLPMAEES